MGHTVMQDWGEVQSTKATCVTSPVLPNEPTSVTDACGYWKEL